MKDGGLAERYPRPLSRIVKNSCSLAASETLKYFNGDECIEWTGRLKGLLSWEWCRKGGPEALG